MPLSFESLSHGAVAFGFFNIESDMLLLESTFLFAEDFCGYIRRLAESGPTPSSMEWEVFLLSRSDVGDLMGAIHGVRFTGFIGDTYRKFPFPNDPAGFKQKTAGFRNRKAFESMIAKYARSGLVPFTADAKGEVVGIGVYLFSRLWFQALLKYVWQGGYPRWQDEKRPSYVMEMRKKISESSSPLFNGLRFE